MRKSKITKLEKAQKERVDVDFYKINKDEYVCISGKDRIETNKIIRDYVGTYEDL